MFIIGSEKSINVVELQMRTGLDWSVSKEKLFTTSGIQSKRISIIREDTQTELGSPMEDYEVFQNNQFCELVLDLARVSDAPIHSFGMFKEGARIFIQVKTGFLNIPRANGDMDTVQGFGTLVNSFDGSTSLGIGNSTKTISCTNTFFAAYKQLDSKIKHTKGMTVKVEDLLRSMDVFRTDEAAHFDLVKRLSEAPATDTAMEIIMNRLFKVSASEAKENSAAKVADRTIGSRKSNQIETFSADALHQLNDKGNTLWGLFSGVTKYTTHSLGEGSEEAKMFGSVASTERDILSKFATLVK
jgi:phage/plasmid-like protein (TIGR03299 family)